MRKVSYDVLHQVVAVAGGNYNIVRYDAHRGGIAPLYYTENYTVPVWHYDVAAARNYRSETIAAAVMNELIRKELKNMKNAILY